MCSSDLFIMTHMNPRDSHATGYVTLSPLSSSDSILLTLAFEDIEE